jgi:hypothetical protein
MCPLENTICVANTGCLIPRIGTKYIPVIIRLGRTQIGTVRVQGAFAPGANGPYSTPKFDHRGRPCHDARLSRQVILSSAIVSL